MSDRAAIAADRPRYMGSKHGAGVFQKIIAAMPPHDTYIETHLGSGAILARKPSCARSIGIDKSKDALALAAFTIGDIAGMRYGAGADHLQPVKFVCGDCVAFLSQFDFERAGRVLIYADPPYCLETRTSSKRYTFDYTEADHIALLDALRAAPAAVILSGYPNALYDRELRTWRTMEFQAMTHGGPRTEKLWLNFPADGVHWATFAGANFIKRQHVKRKAARWAAKYAAMGKAERLAVMAALMAVDHS